MDRPRSLAKGDAIVRRVIFLALAVFTVSIMFGLPSASAVTQHCPAGGTKTEVSDSFGKTLTLPAGTEFCVKAGTGASGILVSDGSPYTVTWTTNGGQTPNISYYVVYGECTPDPYSGECY
jgi:hypothetical protein